ncbi:flocculation protein FLO11-like isoform X2 [Manihot esculenta]|uniref:flocculation protein FLO11-like isoform X2 n=1 Tax=Manihot esculenta TaxID=3983 RepID=UPI001CC43E4B|nr:flocculation protein FLO11-like isoform X2 [Manihot esculenta]
MARAASSRAANSHAAGTSIGSRRSSRHRQTTTKIPSDAATRPRTQTIPASSPVTAPSARSSLPVTAPSARSSSPVTAPSARSFSPVAASPMPTPPPSTSSPDATMRPHSQMKGKVPIYDLMSDDEEEWEVKPEILRQLQERKMQPRTIKLIVEASEGSSEDTTSSASEEIQADSPPKKKQKKRMPRIAGGKARYLPAEQDLHGNFSFVGDDEVLSFHHDRVYFGQRTNHLQPQPPQQHL